MRWVVAVLSAALAASVTFLLFLVAFASVHFEGGIASGIAVGIALLTAGATYHAIANKREKSNT